MSHVGFRYTIQWFTPCEDPPNDLPRMKAEMFETVEQRKMRMDRGEPPVPVWFSNLHKIGDHYCVYIQAINTPMKGYKKETLSNIRKKRAFRRIQKKYPLFIDEFLKEELDKKPEYYAGETKKDLEKALQEVLDYENKIYTRFLEITNGNDNG